MIFHEKRKLSSKNNFSYAEHVRLRQMTGQDNMAKLLKDCNDKDKSDFPPPQVHLQNFFASAAKQRKDYTELEKKRIATQAN